MKKIKKLFTALFSASFIFAGINTTAYASELPEYIRVGLQMSYADKSAISIENDEIRLVRTEDGEDNPLENETVAEFSSKKGFTVRVGLSNQVAIPINADSLEEAEEEAEEYIDMGYANALPGYYRNDWAVIIFGFSSFSSAKNEADDLDGYPLTAEDVIILDIDGDPVFLIANSDAYFMGEDEDTPVDLGSRSYRGIIDFMKNEDGTISAVNVVDLEEYLYGVVPGEISPSYEFEAIKAQACAARTYALYKCNRKSDIGYDICDSTHCQIYLGYGQENEITTEAIDETEGELIYYEGNPIEAYFFGSSGGYTEDVENVWGTKIDYLRAVDDSEEINCPTWTRTLTLSDLDRLISARGYGIGSAKGMRITIDNKTSRVQKVEFIGTNGTKAVTLEACRTVFSSLGSSFNSRNYTITNGVYESGSEGNVVVNANLGTFVTGPLEDFEMGSNYIIGSDCAVVYSSASGTTAYGYDGKEIDVEDIPELEQYLKVERPSTGTTVISSKGNTIKITGYGVGHGVGLSQMGANGMAKNGADYIEILEHYYTGVTVE